MAPDNDIVACSECGKPNRLPAHAAGANLRCGHCRGPLVLPMQVSGPSHAGFTSRLTTALADLKISIRAMEADVRDAAGRFAAEPERLVSIVRTIEARQPRPPRDPGRFVTEWADLTASRSDHLSRRAIANLCWVSDVALDHRFHDYLDRTDETLSPRSVKGIVGRYHGSWSDSGWMNDLAWSLRRRVEQMRGKNGALARWGAEPARVFGPRAPEKFAEEIVRLGPERAAKAWEIDQQSVFFSHAMLHAGKTARQQLGTSEVREAYFNTIVPWAGWGSRSSEFRTEISAAILDPRVDATASRERLQAAVLQHPLLGDPRLQLEHWRLRATDEARNRVLQHLSQEDITFFFDHILPDGEDPHGRKKFWLQYVKRVRESRPLLSPVDRVRLKRSRHGLPKHCGVLKGSNGNSAFLLMFDNLLAIEFSRVGRIYFFRDYKTQIVPEFWTNEPFDERVLKDQTLNLDSFPHVPPDGWQRDVATFLRSYGITPESGWR